MNWRDLLLDNLGFKLAALVVVGMLWVSVTADERQAQPVPTALSVEVRDTSWILMESPGEVSTTFTGRNRELLGLLMERPVATLEVDSVTGERMRVALPVDRVEYDRDLGVVPSFINPSAVDLRFERRRSVRVPVVADVEAVAASGFTVVQPITVEPESVTVRGPASWIEDVTRISTRAVRLDDLSNSVIRDIPLDVSSAVPGVDVEPSAVLVTVTLDSLVVRELRVPVRPVGAGAEFARVAPDSVAVTLRGVAGAVEELASAVDVVEVEVATRPERPYQVTLRFEGEADGPVAVALEPPIATVEPQP
ncbi:MAG TPA: YbbR-like domain-containing protein [Gemmatimonadota bacterium]|nr:YbbR-like domain-containing protein [Gemmatimonadota bacterium]